MGYIYKIFNDVNDKVYIGLTTQTIEIRWRKHLENVNYVDYYLYRAMRKIGIEYFHVELVEEVEDDLIQEREMFWIKFYDSFNNGYNLTIGGEGYKLYEKEMIYSLWDEGLSINQITIKLGTVRSVIYECLLDYENYSVEESFKRRNEILSHPVCQFDIDGNLLNTFLSEKEANIFIGSAHGSIGNCCNNFEKYKTVKGYIWLWQEDSYLINDRIIELRKGRRSIKQMQKVAQLDENNCILKIFNSAKEAARFFGRKKDSHIGDCCKGRRKTCFGYKWKYYDDILLEENYNHS